MAEKATWGHLKDFLQEELNLREALILNQKSKECLGVKNTPKNKRPGGVSNFTGATHAISEGTKYPCYICGKTDHILSTDPAGKVQVDYFSCPVFANMSCKDRKEELRKKGFCFQCLTPGMKFKEQHKCYSKYTCTQKDSHKKFSARVSV